jgi:hypothetical protein
MSLTIPMMVVLAYVGAAFAFVPVIAHRLIENFKYIDISERVLVLIGICITWPYMVYWLYKEEQKA